MSQLSTSSYLSQKRTFATVLVNSRNPFSAVIATCLTLLSPVGCRDEYTGDRDFYRTESALAQVPDDIPDDAKEVYLTNNAISTLSAGAFSGLSQCTDLDLTDNSISTIDKGAFTGKYRASWCLI